MAAFRNKFSNCTLRRVFWRPQNLVDFLGHRVSAAGLEPLPQKVVPIENFLSPTIVRKLGSSW